MKKNAALAKKISMGIIAIIGWYALGLQLYVMIDKMTTNGYGLTETIANFFSYFTILTNLLVAISLTLSLLAPASVPGRFFGSPFTQSAIAVYILIVGIIYSIALRKTWNPEGLQLIADRLLHDAVPLLYFIFWILFVPGKLLQWKDPVSWLIYPLIYLVYILVRGSATGWYPYPFLNISELGYGKVILNIGLIGLAFLVVGVLLVTINRLIIKK